MQGTFFHRQPLLRELKEVNYLFSGLSHTKVVLIAGNHDYLKRDSYYHRFSWNENVLFLGEDRCGHVEFKDIETSIYGFSYASREIREPLYDSICVESDRCFKILLAHGGDEKHIPIDRRKLMTSGFDYIALGHIHKPQVLVRAARLMREHWSLWSATIQDLMAIWMAYGKEAAFPLILCPGHAESTSLWRLGRMSGRPITL